MKGKSQSVEDSIRIEAYLLSEKAGHPSGMDAYFWEQARAIVQARSAVVAVAVKKAASSKKPSPAKPKAAKPKAAKETKPKAAPAKDEQLALDTPVPTRKRAAKK